jgi:WD40 repeat protein
MLIARIKGENMSIFRLKKCALWLILLAGFVCVMPVSAQTSSLAVDAEWLYQSNRIAIAELKSVALYTPQFELIERIEIPMCPGRNSVLHRIAWSPDEHYFAVVVLDQSDLNVCPDRPTSGNELQIWDARSRRQLARIRENHINDFAWTADSQLLAVSDSGNYVPANTIFYDPHGREVKRIPDQASNNLAMSPRDAKLAFNGQMWHFDSQPPVFAGTFGDEDALQLTFDDTGDRLAFIHNDYEAGIYQIEIWDANSLEQLRVIPFATDIAILKWRAYDLIVQSFEGEVTLWDARTGRRTGHFKTDYFWDIQWSPDGQQLLFRDERLRLQIRDAATADILAQLDNEASP